MEQNSPILEALEERQLLSSDAILTALVLGAWATTTFMGGSIGEQMCLDEYAEECRKLGIIGGFMAFPTSLYATAAFMSGSL